MSVEVPSLRHVALLFGAAGACTEYQVHPDTDPVELAGAGSISGRACDLSRQVWLEGAQASANVLDDQGHVVGARVAYSDHHGAWRLDELVTGRDYEVVIRYGEQVVWADTVHVGDPASVELDEPSCGPPPSAQAVVVTGAYDDLERVLADLGLTDVVLVDGSDATALASFLVDPRNLEPHDLVVFDGGIEERGVVYDDDSTNAVPPAVLANLRDFVSRGGTVVASDWSYDVIEAAWPDAIDFLGDDAAGDAAQRGEAEPVAATVSDAAMAGVLGTAEMDIDYDLPGWPVVVGVQGYVSVHVSGTVHHREGREVGTLASAPLLASFSSGSGRVVLCTFRVSAVGLGKSRRIFQYLVFDLGD